MITPELRAQWKCMEEERARQEQEKDIQKRITDQLQKFPSALRDGFDLKRHPCPLSHEKVMEWYPGGKGLMLYGITGKAKTRSLIALCQRLLVERKIRVITFWPCARLADKISAQAFESVSELDKFIEKIEHAELLILDDLGTWKTSERVASEFHRIIDARYSNGRPILATTNATPPELQDKLLDEHGRTIRRLEEMTEPIKFE